MCGGAFGLDGKAIPLALVSRQQPFILGVYTDTTTALTAPTTGFNLDYTQVCINTDIGSFADHTFTRFHASRHAGDENNEDLA